MLTNPLELRYFKNIPVEYLEGKTQSKIKLAIAFKNSVRLFLQDFSIIDRHTSSKGFCKKFAQNEITLDEFNILYETKNILLDDDFNNNNILTRQEKNELVDKAIHAKLP